MEFFHIRLLFSYLFVEYLMNWHIDIAMTVKFSIILIGCLLSCFQTNNLIHLLSFSVFFLKSFEYGRSGNPTRDVLERCLASLDNGKYGLAFSSGLGAQTIISQLLSAGDHIICGDDVYGGTGRQFRKVTARQGITIDFVDFLNLDNVKNAIKPNTRVRNTIASSFTYFDLIAWNTYLFRF